MSEKGKERVGWRWSSAMAGAAAASLFAAALSWWPREPAFHLAAIKLKTLRFKPPVLHPDLTLTVHIRNPNFTTIAYSPASLSIFYEGSLLGSAVVHSGSQGPSSCNILSLLASIDFRTLADHAGKLFSDVKRRQMEVSAALDIDGIASVLWWEKRFRVHVDSRITLDPLFLDVIDQENKAKLNLFIA